MTYWMTTTTASTTTLPVSFLVNDNVVVGGYSYPQPVKPREVPPLEWLAAEVEKTCALARRDS